MLHAGLVETSSNLASVKPEETEGSAPTAYKVNCSTRSSLSPALEQVRDSIARLARLVGGHMHLSAWRVSASASSGAGNEHMEGNVTHVSSRCKGRSACWISSCDMSYGCPGWGCGWRVTWPKSPFLMNVKQRVARLVMHAHKVLLHVPGGRQRGAGHGLSGLGARPRQCRGSPGAGSAHRSHRPQSQGRLSQPRRTAP